MNNQTNEEQLRIAKIDAARRYLDAVKTLKRKAEIAAMEYDATVQNASGLRGIDYSRDSVTTSPTADAIHNSVMRYQEQLEILKEQSAIAEEAVDECYSLIDRLENNDEAAILRMNFLVNMTLRDIAFALCYGERTVYRKRSDALEHLYEIGLPVPYRLNRETAL